MKRRVAIWIWVAGKKFAARHDVSLVPRVGERLILADGPELVVKAVIWDLREDLPNQPDEWAVNLECEPSGAEPNAAYKP